MELLKSSKTTISSLELVEQINIFRAIEREKGSTDRLHADTTHDSLLKIIREEFDEEIGIGELNETQYIHQQNKQLYPKFELTLAQAKQVLVRESKIVRKAVISYIERLENELNNLSKPKLPTTYLDALKELVIREEENQKLLTETIEQKQIIEEQKPKVEFYDQVADTTTSFDMQEVSAMLKLNYGRNVLFRKLRDAKILMNDNLPYRGVLDSGYFIVVETKWLNPRTDQSTATFQTRITQKGLEWLQKNKERLHL